MAARKSLAASKLAAYAEDPKAFIRAKGMPYNPKSAAAGTLAHAKLGAAPKFKTVMIVAVIIAVIYLCWVA